MKINFLIKYLVLLALCSNPYCSIAQNTTDLEGEVEIDHISYFDNIDDKVNGRNQIVFQLETESKVKSPASFFSSIEFRQDIIDKERNRVYIDEAYIDLKLKKIDFRFGKQIISWGKADAINPTNNLNPVDYSDILDTENETIGIIAANVQYYFKSLKVQGIFNPVFESSVLPVSVKNRWFYNLSSEIAWGIPFLNISTDFLVPDLPENDIRSFQYGLLLGNTKGRFDFSINYFKGYNDIPAIETHIDLPATDSIHIIFLQNYYKMEVAGFDFSTILGDIGLRGEGALFFPSGIQQNETYFQYSIGIDKVFSNVIGSNNIFFLVQWMNEITESGTRYSNFDLNHLFQKSILSRIEIDLGVYADLTVEGIYNLHSEDYYLHPGINYQIKDGLNANVSFDILDGKEGGFFSYYKNNKRIQIKLVYNF